MSLLLMTQVNLKLKIFNFSDLCLFEHNNRREKHKNTGSLMYDQNLEKYAQDIVHQIATTGNFTSQNQSTFNINQFIYNVTSNSSISNSTASNSSAKEEAFKEALIAW